MYIVKTPKQSVINGPEKIQSTLIDDDTPDSPKAVFIKVVDLHVIVKCRGPKIRAQALVP